MSERGRRVVLAFVLHHILTAHSANAEPAIDQRSVAELLFREGRLLLQRGETQRACERFAASQELDPAPSTLLNLGLCHLELGRSATAFAELLEARRLAAQVGDGAREDLARVKAAQVEKQLALVTVVPASPLDGLLVTLDGQPVPAASFETPFPVDPGRRRFEATAPGRRSWSLTLEIPVGPSRSRVEIPALPAELDVGVAPMLAPPPEPTSRVDRRTLSETSNSGLVRTFAWISLGVGVSSVAVGSYYGLRTFSKKGEAESRCELPDCEDPAGRDANAEAFRSAHVADIAFLVGLPALAVGGWLLYTTTDGGTDVSVYFSPAGARMQGRF